MTIIELFMVVGHTGEYSSRKEWVVAVCQSAEAAQVLEAACIEWARSCGLSREKTGRDPDVDSEIRYLILDAVEHGWLPDAPDQQFAPDYTGVEYFTKAVPFRIGDLDQFVDSLIHFRHTNRENKR